MLCVSSALYAVVRWVCLSVRPSRFCIVPKQVIIPSTFFSRSDSHTILVFPYPNLMAIVRRGPSNGGVECRRGMKKSPFSTNISLHRVLSTVWPSDVVNRVPTADRGKLVTLIALSDGVCSSRETDDEAPRVSESWQEASMLRRRHQKQNLIVRIAKSEAARGIGTWSYMYWQIRSIERPLCES